MEYNYIYDLLTIAGGAVFILSYVYVTSRAFDWIESKKQKQTGATYIKGSKQ